MQIQTTRFGKVEIDDRRIMDFSKGMVGFPNCQKFALIQTNDEGVFFWLQSLERAEMAFVVCDPRTFVPDYRVPVKVEELELIGLESPDDAQVLVIVNKIDEMLTGNLQGPLVINARNLTGKQLVLSDKRYTTRHPFMQLGNHRMMMPISKTA
ncbi:MAG: flagellar assembly protein FliW [Phycisphaerae bacterium]